VRAAGSRAGLRARPLAGHARKGPGTGAVANQAAAREALAAGCRDLGIDLGTDRIAQLGTYLRLLERWSRAYNLSGPAALEDAVHRHLLDSLAVLPYLRGDRCLDVGTGAGLPGLVLAVADPARSWVLLDSSGKKARFCRQAVLELGLRAVEVVQARVEHYRPALEFDTVTARAWAAVPAVIERVWRMVAPGGRVLVMKGTLPGPELAATAPSAGTLSVVDLRVPGLAGARHLVVVERSAQASPGPPLP
jgi:16S rRNA (guanine527-N7)-methyltransferase